MYARIENGAVAEYPLTEHEIKARWPERLFTTDFLSCLPDGYVCVLQATSPASDLVIATEATPTLIEGKWVQTWVKTDRYTTEELAEQEQAKVFEKWQTMRAVRDSSLQESTWVLERHKEEKEMGITTTLTETQYMAWLTYRQQLRDFPETVTDINRYAIPTPPGILGVA